ncbi:MAG: hypothetical protein P8N51_10855 [Pseudomonadales bacterium]|nr:hypothetical protein [Pseudomonadales bacterium]MDG1441784.1 hypothetical protein [Pseudomonadales bacterium]
MYKVHLDKELRLVRLHHYGDFVGAEIVLALRELILNWSSYSPEQPLDYYHRIFVDVSKSTRGTLHDSDNAFHHLESKKFIKWGFAGLWKMVILKPPGNTKKADERFKRVKEVGAWREFDITMVESLEEVVSLLDLPAGYEPAEF